jgi:class 3 adenylate cyclase
MLNLAAQLSSQAADGEIVISEARALSVEISAETAEGKLLNFKGISQPESVRILRPGFNF